MPDDILTIGQVCGRLPGARGAKRVTPSTITRWITRGCPSRTGERVKLRAIRAGGRWVVRECDLAEFFLQLAGDATPPTPPRSPTARNKASERAAEELKEMGA
jgi:hypothetical protein